MIFNIQINRNFIQIDSYHFADNFLPAQVYNPVITLKREESSN